MRMKTLPLIGAFAVTSFFFHAQAATVAWDGPTSGGSWSTAANWSNDLVPGMGDSITIGNNSSVVSTTAIILNNEGPGAILIASGSNLTLNNTSITLEQSPALVTIQGALNLTGSSAFLASHSEMAGTQGTFRLNGGSITIGDWNNTIRSINAASGAPMMDFVQVGDVISMAGISAGTDQTNYISKFATAGFFGVDGTLATFTNTATGAQSQVINGKQLIRTDDFANGTSTLTLVPEPSVALLGGLSLLGLLRRRR